MAPGRTNPPPWKRGDFMGAVANADQSDCTWVRGEVVGVWDDEIRVCFVNSATGDTTTQWYKPEWKGTDPDTFGRQHTYRLHPVNGRVWFDVRRR